MSKYNPTADFISATLLGVVLTFIVSPFFIMLAWWWIIPDIFAGMVVGGLLPATLTYIQCLKISLVGSWIGLHSVDYSLPGSKNKKEKK